MPRLFVALDPPEEVKDALDRLCEGLPGVRWSDPQQFHLTLRFIGEVGQGLFYEIGEALAGVSHPPFELSLKGLGQFPPRGAPHTLWVGVDDQSGAVATLRRRIERRLGEVGVEPERRKFAPHVTLGRFARRHPRSAWPPTCFAATCSAASASRSRASASIRASFVPKARSTRSRPSTISSRVPWSGFDSSSYAAPITIACKALGVLSAPLIGNRSIGQAETIVMQSISARRSR